MQPSGIRKFFDVAAMMEGVISLGVGEPDFQTPWVVRKEAVDILERKRIIYSANSGMINLRKEIANYLNRKYDLTYDPDSEVIATVGGSRSSSSAGKKKQPVIPVIEIISAADIIILCFMIIPQYIKKYNITIT